MKSCDFCGTYMGQNNMSAEPDNVLIFLILKIYFHTTYNKLYRFEN